MRPAMKFVALAIAALWLAPVSAKLPDLDDKGKADAAAAAAKAAWSNNIAAYQLCRAMDRTAEHYRSRVRAVNMVAPTPVETPPCNDPGQFVAPVAPPPLEASGAHSPAATAAGPPGSKATAAQQSPAKNDVPPPLEASGAHSPPATAIAPPSSKPTAVEIQGPSKK